MIQSRLYIKTTVTKKGTVARSWVFRYSLGGLVREKGLGSVDGLGRAALSESAAKRKADVLSGVLAQNLDPFGNKARKQATFGELYRQEIAKRRKRWSVKSTTTDADGNEVKVYGSEQDWLRWLNTDLATLAKMNFSHPGIEDQVDSILGPIWGSKDGGAKKAEDMATAIFATFHRAAIKKLWVGMNPADRERLVALHGAGRDSRTKQNGGDVESHAMLPWADCTAFYGQLWAREAKAQAKGQHAMAALGLAFLMATTARSSNVRFANKGNIDRQARTWTIPGEGQRGERMKTGVPHVYHLNDQAMAIVDLLWDLEGDLLFPGTKPGQPMNATWLDKLLCGEKAKGGFGLRDVATVHGFRSSFGTWAKDNTSLADYADAMLAHAEGKVKAVYQRSDAPHVMRGLADAWGRHLAGLEVEQIAVNVIKLRA